MSYSRQLITDITDHISTPLREFFETQKNILSFPSDTLQHSVAEVMNSYFDGESEKYSLSQKILTVKKSRYRKKLRWHKTYLNDYNTYPLTSPDHPAAHIIRVAKTVTPAEYRQMYGTMSLEEIVQQNHDQEEEWFRDPDSMLIAYPAIKRIAPSRIYLAFRVDLITDIWDYITKSLDGNIGAFTSRFPEDLIPLPIFSAKQYKEEMAPDSDLLENKTYDDDGREVLLMTVNPTEAKTNPIMTMDSMDRNIFSALLARTRNSFYSDKKIVINLTDLCRSVIGRPKVNSLEKERIKNRVQKFTDYSYTFRKDGQLISFNFFDNVVIKEGDSGEETVAVTVGDYIHSAVVEQKVISVLSGEMMALENKLSQVIFYAIQKERIKAVQSSKSSGMLSYSTFFMSARFPSSNKKKNMKEIRAALDEFVNKKIAIRSYSIDGDVFRINFIPMSEDEMEDLNLERNRLVLE